MLSLSSQTPSQPKSFLEVSRTARCESRSNDHKAGSGPSQSLRFASSFISMLRSRCFLYGVQCNARTVERDCRKNSVGDLSFAAAIEIGDVNGVVAFKSDVPLARECRCQRDGQRRSKNNY